MWSDVLVFLEVLLEKKKLRVSLNNNTKNMNHADKNKFHDNDNIKQINFIWQTTKSFNIKWQLSEYVR